MPVLFSHSSVVSNDRRDISKKQSVTPVYGPLLDTHEAEWVMNSNRSTEKEKCYEISTLKCDKVAEAAGLQSVLFKEGGKALVTVGHQFHTDSTN